jgi:8-hydroxy-5-deazaflavin:NADPH oxidoreductase
MRIGILGSGRMGAKLGTIWARAGHDVLFSYSRSPAKLRRLGNSGSPAQAAANAAAVLLAVHWSRVDDVLSQAGDLSGKTIVSCSLPMNADDTELVVAHTSSGAEELARKIPAAHIVSAFSTVPSEVLLAVFAARRRKNRPNVVYCGDEAKSKRVVARLIRDAGFDPLDCGPLRIARYIEPFTMLVGQLAYERPGGPELAYRFLRS